HPPRHPPRVPLPPRQSPRIATTLLRAVVARLLVLIPTTPQRRDEIFRRHRHGPRPPCGIADRAVGRCDDAAGARFHHHRAQHVVGGLGWPRKHDRYLPR